MWQTTKADSAALTLAPPPDFRYVGLAPGTEGRAGRWAGALSAGAVVGAGLYPGLGVPRTLAAASAAFMVALAIRRVSRLRENARDRCPPSIAIVPWGVLVETEERSRALHWAGIDRVKTDVVYGRDLGTPTTRYSLVTIETAHERLVGRAAGAVSLDRLFIHLGAYAREASHVVALDLDGQSAADGPSEPSCESLVSAARAYVASGVAAGRLDLPARSFRRVLLDRTAHAVDPRPFAAVVAAELHASPLVDELVELVQSPHPVVAAVAKVAASKLGVRVARVGALDEVEPFLMRRDVEALAAWSNAP
jgi:hypothetical protein